MLMGHCILALGMSLVEAMRAVRDVRPVARPNPGFMQQLVDLEREATGKNTMRINLDGRYVAAEDKTAGTVGGSEHGSGSRSGSGSGGGADVVAPMASPTTALADWARQRQELSIGLEVECFLPDVASVAPQEIPTLESKDAMYDMVASQIEQALRELPHLGDALLRSRHVTTDLSDWGYYWIATKDGSIIPSASAGERRFVNALPIELVSKRMGFDECDVVLFCDMIHVLRGAPFRALANESTGFHVHLGKHPGFFTLTELTNIVKSYLSHEEEINRVLPLPRRHNQYCIDLRTHLSNWLHRRRAEGSRASGSEVETREPTKSVELAPLEDLLALIDAAKETASLSEEEKAALAQGLTVRLSVDEAIGLFSEGRVTEIAGGVYEVSESVAGGVPFQVRPQMVLTAVGFNGRELWHQFGHLEGSGKALLPRPWEAIGAQKGSKDGKVELTFHLPGVVGAQEVEMWLFRKELGFAVRSARYCKLNLHRIAEPLGNATVEFRQFPGALEDPLVLWGWVKFLGLLVTTRPLASQPLSELLQHDTLLVAWWRQCQLRQPGDEAEARDGLRGLWEGLWEEWSRVSHGRGSGKEALLEAARLWRHIYWLAPRMRSIFPPADPVWRCLCDEPAEMASFSEKLFAALRERLEGYIRTLAAVEEVSRSCRQASTVVQMCLEGPDWKTDLAAIRYIQHTIQEAIRNGWEKVGATTQAEIVQLGTAAAGALLDHVRNLLVLCEAGIPAEWREKGGEGLDEPEVHQAASPSLQQQQQQHRVVEAAIRGPQDPLRLIFDECCRLMIPRADEVDGVWKGLRERGWSPERVGRINRFFAQRPCGPGEQGASR